LLPANNPVLVRALAPATAYAMRGRGEREETEGEGKGKGERRRCAAELGAEGRAGWRAGGRAGGASGEAAGRGLLPPPPGGCAWLRHLAFDIPDRVGLRDQPGAA
jgi:hypothetical protein